MRIKGTVILILKVATTKKSTLH